MQLSKFGLLKSAVSASQVAAQALVGLTLTSSPSDVTTAVGNFFNTFNSAVSAAKNAAAVPGSISSVQSANRVATDLKRAMSSDPATQAAMKKLGLTVQSDGTLMQDAKKFAAALSADPVGVRTALATIGKQVDTVATKELATSGAVDSGMSSLSKRSVTLAAQQKAMKALETAMDASMAATATSVSATATSTYGSYGLAAYQTNSNGF